VLESLKGCSGPGAPIALVPGAWCSSMAGAPRPRLARPITCPHLPPSPLLARRCCRATRPSSPSACRAPPPAPPAPHHLTTAPNGRCVLGGTAPSRATHRP
jgi:hypothetical protein